MTEEVLGYLTDESEFKYNDINEEKCINCGKDMKRLHWIFKTMSEPEIVFTQWYCCTGCGQTVFYDQEKKWLRLE